MSNEVYLTIHGHFYQPPRENPWLEAIESQDSAAPFHDWNERINKECYNPNSVSKIVDSRNRIIDVVNNYSYMSFNIGATLMSWMEQFAPLTYERILEADKKSLAKHNGHGNAIAQVYNHMIMPLANENDKQTQVIWGLRDFERRFGRKPEGMWLAETAVDDDTLRVLAQHGVKYTILSPFQALRVRGLDDKNWQDVSWGNVDPARAYRYNIKSAPGEYIDLFFYDGAISRSVAFDELLTDGNKFSRRLGEGISCNRDYAQLVNIATDGESYGHHTKFGDMALAYLLKVKAKDEGFTITNYGEYLEKYPPVCEADIKEASSWSCCHGVKRWTEDCGCSTGGHPGWNQKWRKPLRAALDYLRDEFIGLFEEEGKKYFVDPWAARNNYIDVILDRKSVKKFQSANCMPRLTELQKVKAIELLEIQRQAMLMYTSCGWFFSELSGIEPVQVLKYAARAMQLAARLTDKDFETKFLDILSDARSNIYEQGDGRDIFERYVRPSVVELEQIAALWAISSLYTDMDDKEDVYSYTIKRNAYKKMKKGKSSFVIANIEVQSKVTTRRVNLVVALVKFSSGDFHCAFNQYTTEAEFKKMRTELMSIFMLDEQTQIIRAIDKSFGSEYFTLKDIFIEERQKILETMLKGKIDKFAAAYQDMYDEGKGSIYHLRKLGLKIPEEFKISARYALSHQFNDLVELPLDDEVISQAAEIIYEAHVINVVLDKQPANEFFSQKLLRRIKKLVDNFDTKQAQKTIELFDKLEQLEMEVDIAEAQNLYFNKVFHRTSEILETTKDIKFARMILRIGERLNINTEFYQQKLDKVLVSS